MPSTTRRRAHHVAPAPLHTESPRTELVTAVVAAVEGDAVLLRIADPEGEQLAWARTLTELAEGDVGREVAVQFERGDPARPVVLGILRRAAARALPAVSEAALPERVVLEARRELVLRCGAASVTLGPRGRVTVRGDHVVSRSTGVNRVNGASVQIN